MKVYIVTYSHSHGSDITIFDTFLGARQYKKRLIGLWGDASPDGSRHLPDGEEILISICKVRGNEDKKINANIKLR